jgi:hypothetical protein
MFVETSLSLSLFLSLSPLPALWTLLADRVSSLREYHSRVSSLRYPLFLSLSLSHSPQRDIEQMSTAAAAVPDDDGRREAGQLAQGAREPSRWAALSRSS